MKICFLYLIIAGMLMISCNTKPERSKPAAEVINDSVYNEPSEHPIYDQLREEMDSTEIYDDNIIYGMWFEPHGATHNIIFHKRDIKDKVKRSIIKKGITFKPTKDMLQAKEDAFFSVDGNESEKDRIIAVNRRNNQDEK
jgi:hypothetical protein